MSFAISGLLMIFLHLAPNLAGAGYSIYQNHGIHVVPANQAFSHKKVLRHAQGTHKSS